MAEENKSQLISEAELIEAINADTLVSISLGAGQPQKNVKLSTLASVVAENMYPIGSIYMSCSGTNPFVIFGFGTWELIKDTFLLGAGDVYDAGNTGGEATHQLSVEEMPSHVHYQFVHFSHEGSEWDIAQGAKSSWWETVHIAQKTGAAGGNQPHNNMPPYLAVYIWKRVA